MEMNRLRKKENSKSTKRKTKFSQCQNRELHQVTLVILLLQHYLQNSQDTCSIADKFSRICYDKSYKMLYSNV